MTRINLFRTMQSRTTLSRAISFRTTPDTLNSVAWGKGNFIKNTFEASSPLVFAALLLVCSLAVGCSSKNEQPKPVSAVNQPSITEPAPITTTPAPAPIAPVQQAAAKPGHRKIVRKAPANATYADKDFGVTFQYPRRYALKTGEAADELVSADPIPMDFVKPGGVALAAVALPESTYRGTDLAAAFFNVSVNKTLTADQCGEFSVPQPNPATPSDSPVQATAQLATPPISKLMIGDMELQSTETNIGGETTKGPSEEAAKYYHVFENGACYEFAMKVSTTGTGVAATTEASTKHVDRDEVFQRLEKILATVKINLVTAPEVNAEAKTAIQPTSVETPAQ
jgi:hypothetical protein